MQMALLERHEAWLWMPHLPHSHTLEHTHRTTILDSSFLTPSQTTAYFISPVSLPRTPRPARDLCRKRRVCGRIYGSACYFPRASFNSSIKLKPSRRLCHFRRDLWLGNLAPPGGSKGSVIQRLWAERCHGLILALKRQGLSSWAQGVALSKGAGLWSGGEPHGLQRAR